MKIKTLAIAACASLVLGLSGCVVHHHDRGSDSSADRGMAAVLGGGKTARPDAKNPRVWVTEGKLSVDQEPLRFFKAQGKVKITWRLPESGHYSFPADGIVIEKAGDEFKCAVDKNPQHFSCENRNSRPGTYKYTVKVLEDGKPLEPLDPVIVNNW